MTADVSFRRVADGDLSELEEMILALYAEDAPGEPMTREKIRHTVQELARHPQKGRLLVFRVGEAMVGYAIVIYFWSNEYGGNIATIDELFVKPQWRGRGIGTMFLDYAANPDEVPVIGLQLETTPMNHRAHAYYARQGFVPVANRHLFKKL